MKWKYMAGVGFMCALLGIMIAMQLKGNNINMEMAAVEKLSRQQLLDDLLQEKTKRENLTKQLDDTSKQLQDYISAQGKDDEKSRLIQQSLQQAQLMAGLTEVKGEGIIVKIDTTSSPNSEIYIRDMLELLNTIRAAGALAISINDQRVIATTEMLLGGNSWIINNNRTSPPFTIKVLGNPDTLEASLKMRDGIYEHFTNEYELYMDIKKDENIVIPKYTGTIDTSLLKPVDN